MNERSQSSQGSRTHTQPIRVLLVEDDPDHAFLIGKTLASTSPDRFELKHCARLDQGIAEIEAGAADVVLLDLCLPDSKGIDTLVTLCEKKPDLPVIVLTGAKDEEMAVALIAQGALAYENLLLIEELERRAAELRASEEKLHRALTTTGVQGWSWDIAAGRITFLGTSTTQTGPTICFLQYFQRVSVSRSLYRLPRQGLGSYVI